MGGEGRGRGRPGGVTGGGARLFEFWNKLKMEKTCHHVYLKQGLRTLAMLDLCDFSWYMYVCVRVCVCVSVCVCVHIYGKTICLY